MGQLFGTRSVIEARIKHRQKIETTVVYPNRRRAILGVTLGEGIVHNKGIMT